MEAALEQYANPAAKLLADYGDADGARYIERLIKPPTFSQNAPTKKRKQIGSTSAQTEQPNSAFTSYSGNSRSRNQFLRQNKGSASSRGSQTRSNSYFTNQNDTSSPLQQRNLQFE
ncbi:unnamed protein product [Calypogeia fissa]